jgi:acetylornithine deacetylase
MRDIGAKVEMVEPNDIPEFYVHSLCHGPNRQYHDRPTVIGSMMSHNSGPTLLVIAHSDTKPVFEPEKWTTNPFSGVVQHGRIHGLGSSDDKWGLATMLQVMRRIRDANCSGRKRLVFVSTIDQESGVGNSSLLLMLARVKADLVLYLDGYQMKVLLGSCGGSSAYLRPRRDMDESLMNQHLLKLQQFCQKLSAERVSLFDIPLFSDSVVKKASFMVNKRADKSEYFLQIDFYTLHNEDIATTKTEFEMSLHRTLQDDINLYDVTFRTPWFEPFVTSQNLPLVKHVADSILEITGTQAAYSTISKHDSFVLAKYFQMPVVVFGPTSIVHGVGAPHNPDESLDVDEAWQACQIIYASICKWLGE